MRLRRRGMTLTELLVAMAILLVGIYAVARGFPALFGNLESERIRTEMARRVEARMEQVKTQPYRVPEAITGHDPLTGDPIAPELYPDESMDPVPGNPRDDLTWVLGETFRVPIAQAGETYCAYPLNLGPAVIQDTSAVGDYLQVYRLEALERTDVGMPLGDDQFYLDEDGYLNAPDVYASAQVDYVWVDENGEPHGVLGEVVENVNANAAAPPVRATRIADTPAFINVLPDQARAEALVPYTTAIGGPTDVASGTAVLEQTYGATLLLPTEDARATMHINYQLKTEPDSQGSPRRVPVMMEKRAAPTQPPYRMDLAFRGIDDQHPLFTEDLLGNALDEAPYSFTEPVYVLVLDLQSGDGWTNVEDWVKLETIEDFTEGRLILDWEDASAPKTPAEARGRDLRIYYRTIAGHTITVQKAPSWFVEEPIRQTYVTDGLGDKVDYRYYRLEDDPDDPTYSRLLFPVSAADQMVMVDYMAGASPPYERISGELYAIPGETLSVTLNEPDVRGVLAVQGVSLTVRGWWHSGGGRVQMVDVDTFLKPEPLL